MIAVKAPAPQPEVWVSIHEASAMLGVSPATLRRWSAAGEVEAFTTPGGHRRFSLATLRLLLPHPADAPVPLATVGATPERMVRVLRRRSGSLGREVPWVAGLPSVHQGEVRAASEVIVADLVRHLDAGDPASADAALSRAVAAASEVSDLARAHGGSVDDVVGLFLRLKGEFVRELAAAALRHALAAAQATALVTRAGEAADRVLSAMVAAYAAPPADPPGR